MIDEADDDEPDDATFFVDSPPAVSAAVTVAEHLLADPAIESLLGAHYTSALRCVTRQARVDVDTHFGRVAFDATS
jgi:hypothetical protein